jgi:hypothetical protein
MKNSFILPGRISPGFAGWEIFELSSVKIARGTGRTGK